MWYGTVRPITLQSVGVYERKIRIAKTVENMHFQADLKASALQTWGHSKGGNGKRATSSVKLGSTEPSGLWKMGGKERRPGQSV